MSGPPPRGSRVRDRLARVRTDRPSDANRHPPASGRYDGGEFAAGLVGACWLDAVGAPAPTDPTELVQVGLADVVDDDTPVAAEPLRSANLENP